MNIKVACLLLTVAIALLPITRAQGQEAELSREEAQIKRNREAIRMLTAKSPPPEAQETHRSTMLRLRRELRDLLVEKGER